MVNQCVRFSVFSLIIDFSFLMLFITRFFTPHWMEDFCADMWHRDWIITCAAAINLWGGFGIRSSQESRIGFSKWKNFSASLYDRQKNSLEADVIPHPKRKQHGISNFLDEIRQNLCRNIYKDIIRTILLAPNNENLTHRQNSQVKLISLFRS